jgi:hypothetical protein
MTAASRGGSMVAERQRAGIAWGRDARKEPAMDRDQQPDGHQPVPAQGIRASDAERERTVAHLRQHVTDGRLTTDEFSERVEAAYTARTRTELDVLLADLPVPPEPPPAAPDAARDGWRWPRPPVIALTLLAITMLVAWMVGMTIGWDRGPGPPFPFFPLLPILFWGFLITRAVAWAARPSQPRDRRDRH